MVLGGPGLERVSAGLAGLGLGPGIGSDDEDN